MRPLCRVFQSQRSSGHFCYSACYNSALLASLLHLRSPCHYTLFLATTPLSLPLQYTLATLSLLQLRPPCHYTLALLCLLQLRSPCYYALATPSLLQLRSPCHLTLATLSLLQLRSPGCRTLVYALLATTLSLQLRSPRYYPLVVTPPYFPPCCDSAPLATALLSQLCAILSVTPLGGPHLVNVKAL